MAAKHGLFGEVDNRTDGVSVIVQGDIKTIDHFGNDILQLRTTGITDKIN